MVPQHISVCYRDPHLDFFNVLGLAVTMCDCLQLRPLLTGISAGFFDLGRTFGLLEVQPNAVY